MEYEEEDPICRLCLTSCGRAFENVELVTTEMLGILGLKLNSNIRGKPVMCKTCSKDLQKWFDFKTMCFYTEDCINSFRDEASNVKLNIGEIYLKKNEIENIPASKYHTVCRLCMKIAEPGRYISSQTTHISIGCPWDVLWISNIPWTSMGRPTDVVCCMGLDDEMKDTALAKGILAMCFSELCLFSLPDKAAHFTFYHTGFSSQALFIDQNNICDHTDLSDKNFKSIQV